MKIKIPSNKKALFESITEVIDTRYFDNLATVLINKKEVYSNSASTILGDPLNALLWYFDQKLSLNKFIKKNEIISLGSITPLLWIDYPCNVEAVIDGLGKCSINFVD